MKANLRKNKLFLINTILLGVSFFVFFIFLVINNYFIVGEGRYSIFTALYDLLVYTKLEHTSFMWMMGYGIIPTILIVITFIYMIIMFVIVIKKNKQIKYSSLIILESIYLVTIIYIYIYTLVFFDIDDVLLPAFSEVMLLPVMLFAIYNLISTIYIYIKDKKSQLTNDIRDGVAGSGSDTWRNHDLRAQMKVNLRKNKLLLINTILSCVLFIVLFCFLFIRNYVWPGEGRYSILTVLYYQLEDIFRMGFDTVSDIILDIYSIILPAILIATGCISMIITFILVIKKNKQIKYVNLIALESIYLATIIFVYIYEALWFETNERLKPALSIIMLLPVILFAIYNLVSTIYIYIKEKRKIQIN